MNAGLARTSLRAAIAAALAACLSLPAAADTLYRWVDARGVVNYSSEPPPAGADSKTVTQHAMTSYDATAALAAAERQNRELRTRLDKLQREVDELKSRSVAATYQPVYQPAPVPQYVSASATTNAAACDPRTNCNRGLAPEFGYPVTGVIVRTVPVYIVPVVPVYPGKPLLPVTPVQPIAPVVTPHKHPHNTTAGTPWPNTSGLSVRISYGNSGRGY